VALDVRLLVLTTVLAACGSAAPESVPDSAFQAIDAHARGVECALSVSAAMAPVVARDATRPGLTREVSMTPRGEDMTVDVLSGAGEGGARTHERFVFRRDASRQWCPVAALTRTED